MSSAATTRPSRAARLRRARSQLRDADPMLARLIDDRSAFDPRAWIDELPPMDLYGGLLFQVTSQKLSLPVTRGTLARVEALFGGHLLSPAELLGGRSRLALRGRALVERYHPGREPPGRPGEAAEGRCPGDGRHAELTDLDPPAAAAAMSHFATDYAHGTV